MLPVAAVKISDPITAFVLVEADDALFHFSCTVRTVSGESGVATY